MTIGPGKYDDLLSEALRKANALRGFLFIIDGEKGEGWSTQMDEYTLKVLPNILRKMANQIEEDNKKLFSKKENN